MKFLADESCDFAVVRTLRDAGYEVLAVADVSPSASDDAVIALAAQENRILLTEDKDFGQLVFAEQQNSGGVILVRFPATARASLSTAILQLVTQAGDHLVGRFTVLQPGRVRIQQTP